MFVIGRLNKQNNYMRKYYLSLIPLFLFSILISCNSSDNTRKKSKKKQIIKRDLDDIKKEGVLNALTTYSSTSYFLYKGRPMGYEYELLKHFTNHLGVRLNLIITNDIDSMQEQLNSGKVDLVAHSITITKKRKEQMQFSEHLYLSKQVLVQKKPNNWRKMRWQAVEDSLIHDAVELIGDTVSVRAKSSYITRLASLSEELGGEIYIDTLPGDLSTDRIIKMVADGKIKYTVADDNIANINASYYPILDIDVPISFSQRNAWALRKNSPELGKALNEWIREMKKDKLFNVIYNKYFKNKTNFRRREQSEFLSLNNNKISKYDELIKKYSLELGWDWRLYASQVYQESKFNPETTSWAGAHGLMQMMPNTAERLSVKDRNDPEQSLRGATKYMKTMWKRFEDIPDSIQRIKFTLAAYNCGYGHVVDARNLAEEEELDSYRWDDGVEEAMLNLSEAEYYKRPIIKYGYVRGLEPVSYVSQIFNRYEHYKQFIK